MPSATPATETAYIVQTYIRGDRGSMRPGEAIKCTTEAAALARADKIWALGRALGVEVVRQTADAAAGDYGEPEYLLRLGKVPELA